MSSSQDTNNLPRHAAVDGEVERVGETDDDVNEEDDIRDQVVVQEVLAHAVIRRGFYKNSL